MPLTRDEIRARSQAAIKTVDVPIPAFDGETIRLRQMTGGALVEYEGLVSRLRGTDQDGDLTFVLLQKCGVDAAGEPLWPEGDDEAAKAVRELPGDVLGLLAEEAGKLHRITDATVEDAAKN